MILQKFEQQAIRAHNWTSFSPEKRGKQLVSEFSEQLTEDLAEVEKLGGSPGEYQERFERLFSAWIGAKSNCISSMITGPARFPTRKAQKANDTEQRRYQEFADFRKRYFERLKKQLRKEHLANVDPVEEMRDKVTKAKKDQELMKAVNAVIRKKKTNEEKEAEIIALGATEVQAKKLLEPDWMKRVGFAQYQLTNNLANIKRMEERLKELEKKATAKTKEIARPDGVIIVENAEADRLQVFFPEKPKPEMIAKLKKNAFKWSPSNGCWQRQLTENAKYSLAKII